MGRVRIVLFSIGYEHRLDAILNSSAVNLQDRSAAWQKSGWQTFDPTSKPHWPDEVRKERDIYSNTGMR